MGKQLLLYAFASLAIFSGAPAQAEFYRIYVVTSNQVAGGDLFNSTWDDPAHLQAALAIARDNPDDAFELWVKEGIYYPGGSEDSTFEITTNVDIYGGFVGGETELEERNVSGHPTILSGDVGRDDINLDGNNIAETIDDVQGDNAKRILTINEDATVGPTISVRVTLDGLIFTGGSNTVGGPEAFGGAIYAHFCQLTLENCHFSGNHSTWGGAIAVRTAFLNATNCSVLGNSAFRGGGVLIVSSATNTTSTFTSCLFSGNATYGLGGGGLSTSSGGLLTMVNCAFTGNYAEDGGGALALLVPDGNFTNCTINGNRSDGGPGVFSQSAGAAALKNCLIWDNTGGGSSGGSIGTSTFESCLVEGFDGAANPRFENALSPALAPIIGGEPRPHFESTAVDSAIQSVTVPETDLSGRPRRFGDGLDIGAYEARDVIYVKAEIDELPTDPPPVGSTWDNPYLKLQSAQAVAKPACHVIFIGGGVYYPDEGNGQTNNDRSSTFKLVDDVPVYGGFSGDEVTRSDRDFSEATILSGDIDKNDDTTDDLTLSVDDIVGGNAKRVVFADAGSFKLNGVVITGADGTTTGGGLKIKNATADLKTLKLIGNSTQSGGGLYLQDSDVTLTNGLITGNRSSNNGGGLYNTGSSVKVINATIANNGSSSGVGAGVYNDDANTKLVNTIIWSNEASSQGADDSVANGSGGSATYTKCLVEHLDLSGQGSGNFDGSDSANDPLFVSVSDGDFHLQGLSPAIDQGRDSANTLSHDIRWWSAQNRDHRSRRL